MARTKKHEQAPSEFAWKEYDFENKSMKGMPPHRQAMQQIVTNPEARSLVGQVLHEYRKAFMMPKVNSNAELVQRLGEFFEMAEQRQIPPTIQEMALYCGYTSSMFRDWRDGRHKGFSDEGGVNPPTSVIIKKAVEILHGMDMVLTQSGKINPVAYIWKAKNWYGERDVQEIVVTPSGDRTVPLTPDEIARNLPEPMESVDVDTDYTVK